MLQDIEPHIFNNQYHPERPQKNDYVLIYSCDDIYLCETDGKVEIPTLGLLLDIFTEEESKDYEQKLIYLFSIDHIKFFLGNFESYICDRHPELQKKSSKIFRDMRPRWMAFAGITGAQLNRWYGEHIFCGKCGNHMIKSETERALVCEKCGLIIYPKISPAVIVAITNQDKLLMSTYANREYKRYALIAGFTEIGETLEETVKREVMEEVGLEVSNIRYYKNQPWSFSDSLLVGFFADLEGPDTIHLDENELSEARWFDRQDIPETDSDISLTSEMIEAFRSDNYPQ